MVKAKRTPAKSTRKSAPRPAKKDAWSAESLTTDPKSKLVDADLGVTTTSLPYLRGGFC